MLLLAGCSECIKYKEVCYTTECHPTTSMILMNGHTQMITSSNCEDREVNIPLEQCPTKKQVCTEWSKN